MTKTVRQFLEALSEQLGVDVDLDSADREEITALIRRLGGLSVMIGATLSNTANPTMLDAGYKTNVIPGTASATIDGRFLPGQEEEFEKQIDALLGSGVVTDWIHRDQAVETDFDGPLVAPTPRRSPCWGCAASGSRRCSCRRTWTSRRCSTGSTSGCRRTR